MKESHLIQDERLGEISNWKSVTEDVKSEE